MALHVVTPPTTEPVSLEEARLYLRVDTDADDALILGLVTAARVIVERQSWHALLTQSLELVLPDFPTGDIKLSRPPLQRVTSVTYRVAGGGVVTVPAETYVVADRSYPAVLKLAEDATWPTDALYVADPVRVNYVAGWATAADVPRDLRTAVLIQLAALYQNRELGDLPSAVRLLCENFRRMAEVSL